MLHCVVDDGSCVCVAHDVSAGSSGAALAKNGVWNRDESHNANADILHAFASMHHDQAVGLKTGKGMLASEDYKPRCEIAPRERIHEVVEGNSVCTLARIQDRAARWTGVDFTDVMRWVCLHADVSSQERECVTVRPGVCPAPSHG